jgi:hypothetical protein
MPTRSIARPTVLAYSIAAAFISPAAWAQQQAAPSDQIEVVTVTAQKRKEDPNKEHFGGQRRAAAIAARGRFHGFDARGAEHFVHGRYR